MSALPAVKRKARVRRALSETSLAATSCSGRRVVPGRGTRTSSNGWMCKVDGSGGCWEDRSLTGHARLLGIGAPGARRVRCLRVAGGAIGDERSVLVDKRGLNADARRRPVHTGKGER
jgi:hypothetical protein